MNGIEAKSKESIEERVQWPRAVYWDHPWNPVVGCRHVSPACDHCYARTSTERFCGSFSPHLTKKTMPKGRGVVFCGNMTDLFGDWMGSGQLPSSWSVIARSLGQKGDATYLWLTKRPDRMCEALRCGVRSYRDANGEYMDPFENCDFGNHYFGFTAENQEWYDRRLEEWIASKPAWVSGWLSAEPLLGCIDLRLDMFAPASMPFKWIVVGCESGSDRRPCRTEWVESIVEQAMAKGIPVFVKQLDIGGKCERELSNFPRGLQIRQIPWGKSDEDESD